MNSEFISRLQNSKFLDVIKKDRNVICIYLGGSRSNGLGHENSDYDIVVITTQEEKEEMPLRMSYQGNTVHWYYRSLEQMTLSVSTQWNNRLFYLSGINLYNMHTNLIYVNNKYQKLFDFILDHKQKIIEYACWQFVLNNWSFRNIVAKGKITEVAYSKYIYHMFVCYCILFNEPFDKECLMKLKRINWIEDAERALSDELKRAEEAILFLNNYYNSHQEEIINLKKYLTEEIEKLKEAQ